MSDAGLLVAKPGYQWRSRTGLVRKRRYGLGPCRWKAPRVLELVDLDGLAEEGGLVLDVGGIIITTFGTTRGVCWSRFRV